MSMCFQNGNIILTILQYSTANPKKFTIKTSEIFPVISDYG